MNSLIKNSMGSFSDKTSSIQVNFNDGLGSMTPANIKVEIFQHPILGSSGGCSRSIIFEKTGDPNISIGQNIHNIVMWSAWWAPTYWNYHVSSFRVEMTS